MKKPSISELTLREKIGQTVALAPSAVANVPDVLEYFENNPFGEMWTAGHMKMDFVNMATELANADNIDYELDIKIREFAKAASGRMKIPFLPALDAERGAHFTFPYFSEVSTSTGIGATGDPEYAYKIGKCVGRELSLAGAKWVWSPVVDNASPFCAISLTRSFSSDIKLAAEMAKAYIKGVQSEGVAATAKHFPGADRDEYRDTHFADSIVRQSLDEWYERQGCIFKACIDAGVYSIMISHSSFPAADDTEIGGKKLPATISKKIITDLLKEKMGFKGVVITDAVEMRAVMAMFTTEEEYYTMLYNAGNDVILGPRQTNFIDIVEKCVKDGKIPESRIDDACQRVLDMKEKLGMFNDEQPEVTMEMRAAAVENTKAVNKEVAPKIISWLARRNDLVPVKKENIKNVHLVYIGYSQDVYRRLEVVKDEFEKHGASCTYSDGIKDVHHIREIDEKNDLIIYFGHLAPHSPYGQAYFFNEKATMFLNVMRFGKEKSIAVSTGSPYIYNDWFSSSDNFLNLYCSEPELLRTFVRGLYGECEFTGVCPYNPDPLAPRL